jgi:hypothetical protein
MEMEYGERKSGQIRQIEKVRMGETMMRFETPCCSQLHTRAERVRAWCYQVFVRCSG